MVIVHTKFFIRQAIEHWGRMKKESILTLILMTLTVSASSENIKDENTTAKRLPDPIFVSTYT